MSKTVLQLLCAAGMMLCMIPRDASACAVPVFRYALDRWAPDAYRLDVGQAALRVGPLAADLRGDGGARLNIHVTPLGPDSPASRATLRFPVESGEPADLWAGELSPESYRSLTESPARTELVRRLLAGETAVWILVEGGNEPSDKAAADLLAEQIARIEKTVPLPIVRPDDPDSQIGPGPKLRVKFSVIRVRRDSADEQFFLSTLAGPGGLATLKSDQPFAAMVFGRGRVLGAWSADKLTPPLIDKASRFLLAACSCEAKELNPGWDLLLRVNWEAELEKIGKLTAAGGPPPATQAMTETVTFQPTAAAPPASPEAGGVVPPLAIAGGTLLVLLLGLAVWRRT